MDAKGKKNELKKKRESVTRMSSTQKHVSLALLSCCSCEMFVFVCVIPCICLLFSYFHVCVCLCACVCVCVHGGDAFCSFSFFLVIISFSAPLRQPLLVRCNTVWTLSFELSLSLSAEVFFFWLFFCCC